MAAITPTVAGAPKLKEGGSTISYYGTSTANQADTLTSTAVPTGGCQRLLYAVCNYSGAPTQAGVTIEIVSAVSSAYDTLLQLHIANAQKNVYIGDPEIWLLPGEAVRISAPAGGGTLTSACKIVLEQR